LFPRWRTSARWRLTALYGLVCFVAGLVLVLVVLGLSQQTFLGHAEVIIAGAVTGHDGQSHAANVVVLPKNSLHTGDGGALSSSQIKNLALSLRDDTLRQLLLTCGIALLVMVAVALLIGWWTAGRVLRPLQSITATARGMSTRNMHERIALAGPRDELRELGETFNNMLDRLDRAFASQRRFIANASHELRTPLAVERATIQVELLDATPEQLPKIAEDLLRVNRRTEQLIEGLLALARSENRLTERHPVALDLLVDRLATQCRTNPPAGAVAGVRIDTELAPLTVPGDELLLGQVVQNLLHNALRYNVADGWIRIRTAPDTGLEIANSGEIVAADEVERLFEPFQRGGAQRAGNGSGAGLGLSIVRSITEAHDGTVHIIPRPTGGLVVTVNIPKAATRHTPQFD
jgi:signal transduction histidine kinase